MARHRLIVHLSSFGWLWELRSINGKSLAFSAQGYQRRRNCIAAARLICGERLIVDVED